MSIEKSLVAAFTVELGVVLVEAGGVEGLAAGLALDADLVEGSPVHRHHGLGREDGSLAGGAAGSRGGSRPTHPATTTTQTGTGTGTGLQPQLSLAWGEVRKSPPIKAKFLETTVKWQNTIQNMEILIFPSISPQILIFSKDPWEDGRLWSPVLCLGGTGGEARGWDWGGQESQACFVHGEGGYFVLSACHLNTRTLRNCVLFCCIDVTRLQLNLFNILEIPTVQVSNQN